MCFRARKTKRYGQRVPIVSYYVGSLAASGSNFDFVGISVTPISQDERAANLTTALGGQRSCYATGPLPIIPMD